MTFLNSFLFKWFLKLFFNLSKTFRNIPTQNFNYAYELSESVKERTIQGSRDRERTILKAKREPLPVGFVQCKSRANRGEFLAKMLAVFTHRTSHIAPQRPEVFVPCLRIVAMPQRTVLASPASSPPPKLSLSACPSLSSFA